MIPGGEEMSKHSSGWSRKFEDPIPLPNGRQLVTLKDAADYITGLPKKETDLPEWQTAIELLMLVARSGPDNDGPHRCHASAEPSCRAGVQSRSQGYPLGETEAQEGRVSPRRRLELNYSVVGPT
jgi:hypothetical protein